MSALLNREFTMTVAGKSYHLPRPNLTMELAYAKHLRRRAIEDLTADESDSPARLRKSYQEMRQHTSNLFLSGHFDWGAPGFHASLNSPRNLQAFISLWTAQAGDKISEERMNELWHTSSEEFIRVINELLNDPNDGAGQQDQPANK